MAVALIETYIPISSSISEATYDSDEQTLQVTFQDARAYLYRGVLQSVWMGLQNAGRNAGSYFFRQIRTSFPYEEV